MENLPNIPIPMARRWTGLRQTLGPLVGFVLVVVGAAWLWLGRLQPTGFVGQVELIQASVNSPDAGLLTNLWVVPLQEVKAGDLVAELITTDPRTVNVRLQAMRDRMRLIELEISPILSRQRMAIDYEQLNVQCARVRAELAMARVNLIQASNEFRRVRELYAQKDRIVSDTDYDLAMARFEGLNIEVEEKNKIVTTTEKSLERLSLMTEAYVPGGEHDPIKQALATEEARIRVFESRAKPLQLHAPMDGVVTTIAHRPGEQLIAGTTIVTITSKRSDRIVAFLPRSLPINPKVGTTVEVSTRSSLRRRAAPAKIIGLAPLLEGVTNAVIMPPLAVNPVLIPATGRPVSISLPPELDLLPGEIVDLRVLDDARASTAVRNRAVPD